LLTFKGRKIYDKRLLAQYFENSFNAFRDIARWIL